MTRIRRLIPLLLLLPAASLSAAPKGERLVSPPLPGFVTAQAQVHKSRSTVVEVPEGETAENWTRAVTTQWFRKLAKHYTPVEYANRILKSLPRTCPDGVASPVETLILSGRDAARFKVICSKPVAGRPESFIMLVIAGKRDMYVKQVAFRGQANSEDFLWGRKFLTDVQLCEKKSAAPACR